MLGMPPLPGQTDVKSALVLILKNAVDTLGGSAGVVATWSEAENRFIASAFYGLDAPTAEKLYPFLEEAIPDLAGSRRINWLPAFSVAKVYGTIPMKPLSNLTRRRKRTNKITVSQGDQIWNVFIWSHWQKQG